MASRRHLTEIIHFRIGLVVVVTIDSIVKAIVKAITVSCPVNSIGRASDCYALTEGHGFKLPYRANVILIVLRDLENLK